MDYQVLDITRQIFALRQTLASMSRLSPQRKGIQAELNGLLQQRRQLRATQHARMRAARLARQAEKAAIF